MTIYLPGVLEAYKAATYSRNRSATAQALTAATQAIVTGASVQIPDTGLQIGSQYVIDLCIDKTGAGTATSAYRLGLVPAGETLTLANVDALLTFTKPAGTAVADTGVVKIVLNFLAIGTAVAEQGSVAGTFVMDHNLAATGHLQIPTSVQVASDTTTATILAGQGGGYLTLDVTTGAADVSSVLWVNAELLTPPAAGG
jgi:hypothetical protein